MNKKVSSHRGKKVFLLGKNNDNRYEWLEQSTFDCDWYWGIGYVETYTNNRNPQNSADTRTHNHFDSMFLKGDSFKFKTFKEHYKETVLTDEEIFKLLELMQTLYTMRAYSDTIHRGGSHYTSNPCSSDIKNEEEYNRINKKVIPSLLNELYKLLGDETE